MRIPPGFRLQSARSLLPPPFAEEISPVHEVGSCGHGDRRWDVDRVAFLGLKGDSSSRLKGASLLKTSFVSQVEESANKGQIKQRTANRSSPHSVQIITGMRATKMK